MTQSTVHIAAEILPSLPRSPVGYCLGTRLRQAAKSRPCLKPMPEAICHHRMVMIGPTRDGH